MKKIIIGIHGLANKPDPATLKSWWKWSIKEGLKQNSQMDIQGLEYDMVYWADLLYKLPQHDDVAFDFDPLYNTEPYIEAKKDALKRYNDSWLDDLRGTTFDVIGSSMDSLKQHLGLDFFADWVLEKVMKDLAFYYDNERKVLDRVGVMEVANKALKDELIHMLEKHKEKEIMLISHSMGTIIAYDVLRDLGQRTNNDVLVKHFVTIGSPLGLPHVKHKIIKQRAYDNMSNTVRTPSIVTGTWVNYADKKDAVALDFHLADDFGKNANGIKVQDDLVSNDYIGLTGKQNHHKSYGYLRTPEISRKITEFLKG